ncbi:zinc-binding dehydrogenase [Novosphingobium resinovorum]
MTTRFPGGYRQYNIAPQGHFVKVADDSPEWLALASTGVSAWMALFHVGQAKPGDVVAISAAAGGLGHLIVQLAALKGCEVVAVCGGPVKSEFARSLGAARVIDYRSESVPEVLAREYPNRLDVAIDTVSGEIFDAFLDNVAPHGRVVVGGAASDLEGGRRSSPPRASRTSSTTRGFGARLYERAAGRVLAARARRRVHAV